MKENEQIKIWGIVKDNKNQPIANTWVKLLRKFYRHKHGYYEQIGETLSNGEGYYEFLIPKEQAKDMYKILVLKEEGESKNGEYE